MGVEKKLLQFFEQLLTKIGGSSKAEMINEATFRYSSYEYTLE